MVIYKNRQALKEHIDNLVYYIIEYNKIKYFINYTSLKTYDKIYAKNIINDIIDHIKELIKITYSNYYKQCCISKNTYLNDISGIFNFTKILIKRYDDDIDFNKINNMDIVNDLNKIIKKLNDNNYISDEDVYKIGNKNNIILQIIDCYKR